MKIQIIIKTAFTVSIDHVSTTTGISAAERSITAMKCVEDGVKPKRFFVAQGICSRFLQKKYGVLRAKWAYRGCC